MLGYILRRLLAAVVVIIGVTIVAFILRDLLPGSLARDLDPRATEAQILVINHQLGLDKPWYSQYWTFLWGLMRGNLGFSYTHDQSVNSIIQHEIMRDVILLGIATVISVMVAIPIGLFQAVRRNTAADYVGTGVAFFFYAIPDFVLGIILVAVFAIHFHVFQANGPSGPFTAMLRDFFPGLTLPIVTEILVGYAAYSRYMRSSAIDSLTQDYIRTARAKGLSERQVVRRHVLRNSLIPMATLLGLSIPFILTSGLLIESVFNFPGIGFQVVQSSENGDFPTVIAITVLIGVVTVFGNLIADVAYGILDPRIRY
jgi:peptide/nickel transport system permease protein